MGLEKETATATAINPSSPSWNDEPPIFKDPLPPEAPRRNLDRRLLESIDADHRRVREISNRLTRLESLFENINQNISRLEQQQREALGYQEQTATNMCAISNKLSIHTEMEEYQWTTVNRSAESLELLNKTLQQHLAESEGAVARLSGIEKMVWALWGVIGAGASALIPMVLKGMGAG